MTIHPSPTTEASRCATLGAHTRMQTSGRSHPC